MNAKLLMVFLGGGMGSLLRFLLSWLMPSPNGQFPWPTLTANLFACALAGLISGMLSRHAHAEMSRYLLLIGFCGGLSTFSTFSLENTQLILQGKILLAAVYTGISLAGGLVTAFGAYKLFA